MRSCEKDRRILTLGPIGQVHLCIPDSGMPFMHPPMEEISRT